MSARPPITTLALTALLLAACGAPQTEGPAPEGSGIETRDGAIILSGRALDDGQGSLLGTMRGKVPNFRIQRSSDHPCPMISLRSHVTFETLVEPHVYVDGTRATDTCILESLRSEDVESVEIYPMGVTKRPGYGTHAHGLILVFMRTE